ncbi:hypothetical protein E4K67_14920 [Desulfosporosinus fructosivorans]|uniref:Uncharacterized protein n=1 Tax=Desulfosporosinus fructosivorans TaxID=2018669 RepID=A0A4Z0R3X6_9FIRM|nr:hypothetical protein [Desulfosporosinus fructosivorans]TGE37169.1 hypothetical protein E4K67_14920 [Desulfosporosinus fructosivorans]
MDSGTSELTGEHTTVPRKIYNIPMDFPFQGLPIGKAMQATKPAIKLDESGMKENNSIPKKVCDTITHLELVKKPSKSTGQFTASTSLVQEETKKKKDTLDREIIWKMIGIMPARYSAKFEAESLPMS